MSTNTVPVTVTEVANGIYRVRLSLPFALNHVNCYLLEDDGGWTMLDTGLHRPEVYAGWQAALAQIGIELNDIRRILVTHMHPDHIGLAGRMNHFEASSADSDGFSWIQKRHINGRWLCHLAQLALLA